MIRKLLCGFFFLGFSLPAFAWSDGELLIWINGDKGYRGLAEVGKKFEKELGVPVKVEAPEGATDKFQAAAQTGKGPDIMFWAHDRIGEWADAGLLKPLIIGDETKAKFIPKAWDAVTHNKQIWGYPLALEAVSLIYNKKYVTDIPPAQLSEIPALAKDLKTKFPNVIPILWDYNTPYFTSRRNFGDDLRRLRFWEACLSRWSSCYAKGGLSAVLRQAALKNRARLSAICYFSSPLGDSRIMEPD